MLTKYDELLCHQIVSTFDHVETSAREWTERTWFSAHDVSGKLQLVTSIALYPNRNIIDTYGTVAVEGKTQYAVRASRELQPERDQTKVGPFSYEVIEPLKRVRTALADNEHGLSYEIDFEAAFPPHEETPQFTRLRGRVEENIARYVQMGKPSGWIKVDGQTYHIDRGNCRAERDHSWGVRRGGGVPETGVQPGEVPTGHLFNFVAIQFEKWSATYHLREGWDGTPLNFGGSICYPHQSQKEELKLASVEHDYQLRSDMRQMKSGRVVLNAVDGSKTEVSFRPISICYLKAGGMFGYRGFTHGLWMGPYYIDGFKLDITDPTVIGEVSFIDDLMCEVRCGNEIGYGINELIILGKYPKYGYQGY